MVKRVAMDLGWKQGRIGVGEHVRGSTWREVARNFKGSTFRGAAKLMMTSG